jgi:HK97 family phage prohead protease
MPYSIIHNHPDCPKESGESGKDQVGGHAVVKDSDNELIGCHKTHKSAMDQITALNIAEAEMKSKENEIELREVDRKPPEFMKKNAQRGLDNLRKAGPGLTDKTKREARDMAAGRPISISKIVRIAAWHKRHIVDLDREKTNPQDPDTWRYSDVAFLLWGSNPWTNPMQAADWADRKIAQLVKEGELEPRNDPSTPAPKKDQIKGSKKNKKGSASGKAGGIKFSDSTEQAIKNRITEHNEEVAGMASWRKLKASSAKAVVRRGFGAYSTSHRPGVSRQAWGLARLKAFSYLLKNDKPKNPNYRSDNDLLPKEHPRYSAKKEEKMSSQHVEVFDKVVAMSQTLEKQRSITNIENMERQTENRSFTFAAVEERNNDDKNTLLFTGYASVFDKPYGVRDSRGQYNETIKQGAFKKTLQEQDDVRFLVNHDGIPLARTSSGTLKLEEDDYGLFVRAELDPHNPTVAEVASAMKRGDLNEMSFAFAAIKDNFDNSGENREVNEARLFDVSVVTYPANPWAGAKLRGVDIDNLHKELVEARNGEQAKEILEGFIDKVADSDNVNKKRSNPKVELLKMKLERDGIR